MLLDRFKLDGRVAIVTGIRRGLGQGMAIGLAEAGADIASFDRNDPVETRSKVQALGRKHMWKQVDMLIATPEEFARLIDEIVAEWGKVDILVNNAGICPREPVLDYQWTAPPARSARRPAARHPGFACSIHPARAYRWTHGVGL